MVVTDEMRAALVKVRTAFRTDLEEAGFSEEEIRDAMGLFEAHMGSAFEQLEAPTIISGMSDEAAEAYLQFAYDDLQRVSESHSEIASINRALVYALLASGIEVGIKFEQNRTKP